MLRRMRGDQQAKRSARVPPAAGIRAEPARTQASRRDLRLDQTLGNLRRTRYRGAERTSFAAAHLVTAA